MVADNLLTGGQLKHTAQNLPRGIATTLPAFLFFGPLLLQYAFVYYVLVFAMVQVTEKEKKTKYQLILVRVCIAGGA